MKMQENNNKGTGRSGAASVPEAKNERCSAKKDGCGV